MAMAYFVGEGGRGVKKTVTGVDRLVKNRIFADAKLLKLAEGS